MSYLSKVFAVGDQLTCQRGSTTLVWDIIGFDIDTPADKQFTHSMTLQLHEVFDFVRNVNNTGNLNNNNANNSNGVAPDCEKR